MKYIEYLRCKRCFMPLQILENKIICMNCGCEYYIDKGVINFSPTTSNNSTYQRINQEFANSFIGKKIRFMNFGLSYMPQDKESETLYHQNVNKNCIRLLEYIFRKIQLKDKCIIDVGCGRGGALSYFNTREDSISYIGIDSCIEGLLSIPTKCNALLLCADACDLPLNEKIADIVLCIESYHAFEKKEKFVCDISRILKENGILILVDIFSKTDETNLEIMLSKYNLSIKEEEDLTENVLRSIAEVSYNRLKILSSCISQENIGAPGSRLYQEMKEKIMKYKFIKIVNTSKNQDEKVFVH